MNKRAKLAIFGIILSVIIAIILIIPFMSKAQAEISYNNNLASTPYEITSKIPLTVEKDSNWQVEWHETYAGLTHREYVIAIQNQKEESNNFALSVIFDSLNFDASQISNVNILEWQKISKERSIYETVENCEYPSIIDNETEKITGNSTSCWNEQKLKGTETYEAYDWVKVKDVTAEQETSDMKKDAYASVAFDGKSGKEGSNIRYFKLGFDVPILKLSDGSFGSQGRVAFIEGNSGKEYHPVWMTNYTYYYNGTINTSLSSSVVIKNFTHLINGSGGWYGNIIWCRNPVYQKSTLNENFTFYENSTTDYRYVNSSDNKELFCESAKGPALNRTTGGSAWDDEYVSVYHFENTIDSIGTQHAVFGSGATILSQGRIGSAANLSGGNLNGNITLKDYDEFTNNITAIFWFKPYTIGPIQAIVSNANSNNWEFQAQVLNTGLFRCLTYNEGGKPSDSKTTLSSGNWYFGACRVNGTNLTTYLNGLAENSNITSASSFVDQNRKWTLGADPANLFWYYGYIDEVRLIGKPLSDDEIRAIYETEKYNYTMLGEKKQTQTSPSSATESQGDDAILQGIANSTINPATTYSSQQVYMTNVTGQQKLGRFDVVAVSGNQRWAFNYISQNENTSNFTYMVNITPSLYVWEATNLAYTQIQQKVTAFINSTKI